MGKTAWQKQWRGSDDYGSSDYWQWQPSKAAKGGQSLLEVKYDQVKLEDKPEQNSVAAVDMKPADGGQKTLAQVVQKAVNAARKATSKCKKMEDELEVRRRKWDAYQQQIKQAFQRQHAQFVEDISKLEGDLDQAREAAEQADENLKQVLIGQSQLQGVTGAALMEDIEAEEDPWQDFVKDALWTEKVQDKEIAAYLRAAQHGVAMANSSLASASVRAPPAAPSSAARPPSATQTDAERRADLWTESDNESPHGRGPLLYDTWAGLHQFWCLLTWRERAWAGNPGETWCSGARSHADEARKAVLHRSHKGQERKRQRADGRAKAAGEASGPGVRGRGSSADGAGYRDDAAHGYGVVSPAWLWDVAWQQCYQMHGGFVGTSPAWPCAHLGISARRRHVAAGGLRVRWDILHVRCGCSSAVFWLPIPFLSRGVRGDPPGTDRCGPLLRSSEVDWRPLFKGADIDFRGKSHFATGCLSIQFLEEECFRSAGRDDATVLVGTDGFGEHLHFWKVYYVPMQGDGGCLDFALWFLRIQHVRCGEWMCCPTVGAGDVQLAWWWCRRFSLYCDLSFSACRRLQSSDVAIAGQESEAGWMLALLCACRRHDDTVTDGDDRSVGLAAGNEEVSIALAAVAWAKDNYCWKLLDVQLAWWWYGRLSFHCDISFSACRRLQSSDFAIAGQGGEAGWTLALLSACRRHDDSLTEGDECSVGFAAGNEEVSIAPGIAAWAKDNYCWRLLNIQMAWWWCRRLSLHCDLFFSACRRLQSSDFAIAGQGGEAGWTLALLSACRRHDVSVTDGDECSVGFAAGNEGVSIAPGIAAWAKDNYCWRLLVADYCDACANCKLSACRRLRSSSWAERSARISLMMHNEATDGTEALLDGTVAADLPDLGLQVLYWLRDLLLPFCLSFVAMAGAALARLLLFGLRLRGGCYNADPLLRGARCVCRGASFAFLITAWMLPVADGVRHVRISTCGNGLTGLNLVDQDLEARFTDEAASRMWTVEHNSATAAPPVFETDAPAFVNIAEEDNVRQVAIRILVLQQVDHYVTLWADEETTITDVRRRVRATITQNAAQFAIQEAVPQLPDDVLTVCVFPSWWQEINRVPVIFAHLMPSGHPFMGVVPSQCSLGDLYDAVSLLLVCVFTDRTRRCLSLLGYSLA